MVYFSIRIMCSVDIFFMLWLVHIQVYAGGRGHSPHVLVGTLKYHWKTPVMSTQGQLRLQALNSLYCSLELIQSDNSNVCRCHTCYVGYFRGQNAACFLSEPFFLMLFPPRLREERREQFILHPRKRAMTKSKGLFKCKPTDSSKAPVWM